MTNRLFITDIGVLALPQLAPAGLQESPVRVLNHVYLEIHNGKIAQIGSGDRAVPVDAPTYSADGGLVTPGFVDSHTHPVFVGWRQDEFVRRCRGETYQQIAAAGGGILSSVRAVRTASLEQLTDLVGQRLSRFMELGVTTLEAKSGYGLTIDDEYKSLRALQLAAVSHQIDISPTLLGAHVVPPEHRDAPERYVDLVCREMIPRAAEERLAESVDVFVEDGAFTPGQARVIFTAAAEAGLGVRIHADQFAAGEGAQLAAEFGALSADHMDYIDPAGMDALAKSGVTINLLPGAVFFLGRDHYAPAREMIGRGCRIALSTDFNPGSSPTQSMPLMLTLSCVKMHLKPSEALWAATMGGAGAVGRSNEVGSLLPGYQADLCVWDVGDLDSLPYLYGSLVPRAVFKRGNLVAERGVTVKTPNAAA